MAPFSRREFMKILGGGAALGMTDKLFAKDQGDFARATRPNVVVIFTDDLDFDEIGVPGYDPVKYPTYTGARKLGFDRDKPNNWGFYPSPPPTPNIASLERDGMLFTRMHMVNTICMACRYALLTGQYCSRSESLIKKHPIDGPANVEFNTILQPHQWNVAKSLQAAGYATGLVGKWHLCEHKAEQGVIVPPITDYKGVSHGPDDPNDPAVAARVREVYEAGVDYIRKNHGFDYAAGIYQNNANGMGLPKALWEQENNMEWFTASALRFIDQNRDRPFFLHFAPNIPHGTFSSSFVKADPRATPEGLIDWHLGSQPSRQDIMRRIKEEGLDPTAAMPMWIDDGIGVILNRLEELGLSDNTVVIFSSDQQSRGKWTCYEGSHVPFLVRWPARIQAGSVCEALTASIDLAPTLLDICGVEQPGAEEAVVDGRSFLANLIPDKKGVPDRPVLVEMGYGRAVIQDDWKYIAVRFPPDREAEFMRRSDGKPGIDGRVTPAGEKTFPNYFDRDQLYDLKADPYEQKNLFGDPARAGKLAQMQALMKRMLAPLPHVFGEFKPGA